MLQRLLKPLRVGVALVFLAATAVLFLDVEGRVPALAFEAVLWPQLAPSLVRFAHVATWGAAGFLLILLLTLVFGRVFCSAICPLGILQDGLIRLAAWQARRSKRVRFRFRRPWNCTRYGLLAATLLAALSGSLLLLAQLDPFSHFGRLMALLVRPLAVGLNNLAARGLEGLGSYVLAPVDFALAHWEALVVPTAVLGLLVWMAWRHGRLFCNSLCPVGTLLGLVARCAMFRVAIDRDRCNLCAKCSVQCKAECIHLKDRRVDFDRCVACFNCIPACPEGGIGYRPAWGLHRGVRASGEVVRAAEDSAVRAVREWPEGWAGASIGLRFARPNLRRESRRSFLRRGAAALIGVSGFAVVSPARVLPKNKRPTLVPVVKEHPVAPPGAGSTARFNLACTACQLCVSACPTQVLQPSLLAYGANGFLQPHMAYEVAYCTYECTRCTEVCPTDAIRPLTVEAKKVAKVGEVRFIEDNCIVVTEETACGACAEHCPTQAVHMVPYRGELTIPALDEAVCIGCGACEHACPVRPYRAIYVEGEPKQPIAEVPKEEAMEVVVPEEFPF